MEETKQTAVDMLLEQEDSVDVEEQHRLDNLIMFIYLFLLILTILMIWLFKYIKIKFIHETGIAVVFGLIVGLMIRFLPNDPEMSHVLDVVPAVPSRYDNKSMPEYIKLGLPIYDDSGGSSSGGGSSGGSGGGERNETVFIYKKWVNFNEKNKIDRFESAATFEPEIFFNVILPPIIFNAGYSMKRKHFFKNFGSILAFALIGTAISTVVTAFTCWGFLLLIRDSVKEMLPNLGLAECIFFGAIISATDPVTVLAIFSEMNVDVDLYALIFGESVMNDAVAIVLASSVDKYSKAVAVDGSLSSTAFLEATGNFIGIFAGSFGIGCLLGCTCAFLTKFTKLSEYPLLETSLVVLMSYSSFLAAEACGMTGIVAVLFCGICQAHYTFNNLSADSQKWTKRFFELLNFLLENFIFSYIGVSVITMETNRFYLPFFLASLLAIFLARACNVYPLAFLLNLGRSKPIPFNHQHMMMFSGLRGAIAFALAIRNANTLERNVILSTTSLIVIVTVVVCGGFTSPMLNVLKIRVGVEDDGLSATVKRTTANYSTIDGDQKLPTKTYKKSWFHQKFGNFDLRFLKPLFTHSKPSLEETCCGCRGCCLPVAKVLTSDRQRHHGIQSLDEDDAFDPRDRRLETPLHEVAPSMNPFVDAAPSPQRRGVGLEAANIVVEEDDETEH